MSDLTYAMWKQTGNSSVTRIGASPEGASPRFSRLSDRGRVWAICSPPTPQHGVDVASPAQHAFCDLRTAAAQACEAIAVPWADLAVVERVDPLKRSVVVDSSDPW